MDSGETFVDSIGGMILTLIGNGASHDGAEVTLPGSSTGNAAISSIAAYLDLPNGTLSAQTSMTFETWVTPESSKNWQRLFDFGSTTTTSGSGAATGEIVDGFTAPGAYSAADNISLTLNNGGNLGDHQLEYEIGDGGATYLFNYVATTPGTEYHYVYVIEDGVGIHGAAGAQMRWYRNGTQQGSLDFPFHLADMNDVNNWIGRSMYGGDSNSNISLNELRIYNRAITDLEINSSYLAGPDPSVGPPEPPTPAPVPVRLWDFNDAAAPVSAGTIFNDASSEGEEAIVYGNNAELTGTELLIGDDGFGGRLTTNGQQNESNISAYVHLPNGFISSFTDLTMEAWITPHSSGNWQRLWDLGNSNITHGTGAEPGEIIDDGTAPAASAASDNIFLSLSVGGDLNTQRFAAKLNGGGESGDNSGLTTVAGTEYHYVMTVEDGAGASGASGCQMKWYRDSTLVLTVDLPFRLQDMEDVNNWLGRSNWNGDENSHMSINELRVYDHAINQAEVNTSYAAGPDAGFSAPAVVDDSALVHADQKVLIDVLANDSNTPDTNTLTISSAPATGTATVVDGKILYSHSGSAASPVTFQYTVANIGGTSTPATVTVNFAASLRIDNPEISMPDSLPPTSWTVEDALPGLTFTRPVCLATIPGDTNQLYVCEQNGAIMRVDDVTSLTPSSNIFLDLSTLGVGFDVGPLLAGYPENGLLGLAFHPDYDTNGYFYVAYTSDPGNNDDFFQRVSRFSRDAVDPTIADPSSELILLEIDDFGANHNGGDLHFGPFDGYLYYGMGDGENSGNGQFRSQVIDGDFYSAIARMDVDKLPGNLEPNAHASIPTYAGGLAAFSVPVDNPFVHTSLGGDWDGMYNDIDYTGALSTIRTEFWATGIRHAWRMSFDPMTGDLWEGDVGQVTYEEINKIQRGGNYGWAWREGAHDFAGNVSYAKPAGWTSIDPIYEYQHNGAAGTDPNFTGNSVCGGYVYRGTRYPELYGYYVFCDSVSGHIWQMDTSTGATTRLTGLAGAYGVFSSMGVDPSNQDILFCAYLNGKIMRLSKGTDLSTGFPATLSETGLFADLTDLSPNPGVLPYFPNLKFWSDHADKSRWLAIPTAGDKIDWAADANWTFPEGMIAIKHFDMEMERGNPASKKRIETRVLVNSPLGFYGVSYRWNDAETEATLVPDGGVEFDLNIDIDGSNYVQHWGIPGRTSCLTCHTDESGGFLSLSSRQFNQDVTLNGYSGNQLTLLHTYGYLNNNPGSPNLLPRHLRSDETAYPLEARVRSYLAVNCAYCHRAGGTAAGDWDGRPELSLDDTNLLDGVSGHNYGTELDPINNYIVPGDPTHSIAYNRAAGNPGWVRMPPLATNELDLEANQLMLDWINSVDLANRQTYNEWRIAEFGNDTSPEGEQSANPDGDPMDNFGEYLSNTDPSDANSYLTTDFSTDGSSATVTFTAQSDRTIVVETSTNLINWTVWDVPGNNGVHPTGAVVLNGPSINDKQFFRLRITEN